MVVSVMLAVGVNVDVYVMLSEVLTELSVPFAIVRSPMAKPVTASENVIVTSDVSPIVSDVSATTIIAVGGAAYTLSNGFKYNSPVMIDNTRKNSPIFFAKYI
ncbi:hypothetical protein D3C81_1581720 [compost metagenome]